MFFSSISNPPSTLLLLLRSLSKNWKEEVDGWLRKVIVESNETLCSATRILEGDDAGSGINGLTVCIEEEGPPSDAEMAEDLYDFVTSRDGGFYIDGKNDWDMDLESMKQIAKKRIAEQEKVSFQDNEDDPQFGPVVERRKYDISSVRKEVDGPSITQMIRQTILKVLHYFII